MKPILNKTKTSLVPEKAAWNTNKFAISKMSLRMI